MYCNYCGAEVPDDAKFCQSCGRGVGGNATKERGEERGWSEKSEGRNDSAGDNIGIENIDDKDAKLPPAAIAGIIAGIVVLVIICAVAVSQCGSGSAATSSSSSSSSQSSSSQSSSSSSSRSSSSSSSSYSYSSSSSSSSSGYSASSSSRPTTSGWETEAREFINIYPANHVLAGGASDNPSKMTVDDWAERCLKYVNPSSTIGERLTKNRVNFAGQLGFYDAQTVVTDTKVTSSSSSSVVVQATLKSTQSSWSSATTIRQSYIVYFNAGGLIIEVKETSNSPKAN